MWIVVGFTHGGGEPEAAKNLRSPKTLEEQQRPWGIETTQLNLVLLPLFREPWCHLSMWWAFWISRVGKKDFKYLHLGYWLVLRSEEGYEVSWLFERALNQESVNDWVSPWSKGEMWSKSSLLRRLGAASAPTALLSFLQKDVKNWSSSDVNQRELGRKLLRLDGIFFFFFKYYCMMVWVEIDTWSGNSAMSDSKCNLAQF